MLSTFLFKLSLFIYLLHYTGPKELQSGYSQVNLRMALESLPVYTPWFIYTITLLQAICIAILCASSGVVAPRLSPQKISIRE